MKIWLAKNSEIAIREQLITQIILGIAGADLAIGEKLPSTGELARRFQIHANTVSNAYQKLCEQGWIEFKRGSGFYVSEGEKGKIENSLDMLIAQFLRTAQGAGFTLAEIKSRLNHFLDAQRPEHFLVIESDLELQKILVEEISQATDFRVLGIGFEDFRYQVDSANSILTAMFDEKSKLKGILPADKDCIFLQTNSVANSMKSEDRPAAENLIAIVSGWERFLLMAKTLLIAAKIDPESLIIRNTGEKHWNKGLETATIIICDILTANSLQEKEKLRPLRLISESSLDELRKIAGIN